MKGKFNRLMHVHMADMPADTGSAQSEPATDQTNTTEVDWKSKYEETLAHSRKWEERAKANKAAADELEQLKESQMSEQQKADARAARLQKELDELKSEKQHTEWRAKVMADTGLPESLMVGDSLEAMQEHAKAIQEYVASLDERKNSQYRVADPTRKPADKPTTDMSDFLGIVFPKQ